MSGVAGARSSSCTTSPWDWSGSCFDTNRAMRAIMYSFGASEQDAEGNLTLKSKETLEAIKFVKALHEETMIDEVPTWDDASNNRFMLAGQGSLAVNPISITRTAENQKLPVDGNLW